MLPRPAGGGKRPPVCFAVLTLVLAAADPNLSTVAEQSKWTRTGRYDEVLRLCDTFAKTYPGKVRCETFGTTPENRPMVMLVAGVAKNKPVILVQGGIHAGEIDGKDAGFWLLRDILDNKILPGVLDSLSLIFVPVFNADGHERFGPNNRPNQRGPAEMGWRTTAQNYNLNRDYMKADAPEMSAMLRLLRERDPIVYVDLHVTDGANFEHDISVLIDPLEAGAPAMRAAGKKMRDGIMKSLAAAKHLPLPFYPSFNREDEPASGFSVGISPPRFSLGYWAIHNRFSLLVETHSWKNYETRVRATRNALIGLLEQAKRDAPEWVRLAKVADEQTKKLGGTNVELAWDTTEKSRTIDFRGFVYRRTLSAVSGGMKVEYDENKPAIWRIPFFDELKVTLSVRAPASGYYLSPAHAHWMKRKLEEHGVEYSVIDKVRPGAAVEIFRATEVQLASKTTEGRTPAAVKGKWTPDKLDIAAGTLFIPVAQARARVVLHLFEPEARDSYVSWGFFNAHFEQKEYVEPYVLEKEAVEMMAKDPALAAEFEQKVAADPKFAQSAEERLEFFRRRHPSYDVRENVVPIYRQ
jgi:hypothetical protein